MASTASNKSSNSNLPSDYGRLKLLWLNFLNSDDAGNDASKTSWLELFLYEFGKLNADQRAQFQRSNISENVSSALSRQLLQFIIEICSRGESPSDDGETEQGDLEQPNQQQQEEESSSSLSSTSTYTTARSVVTTDRSDNRQPQQGQEDSNEERYQDLRTFLLEGIGGRILRALEQLGGQDIVNGREIAEVLIRILPTRKWCTPQLADLEYQHQYNAQLLKVFDMRTCNSDWRNETNRASLHTTICGMQALVVPSETSPEHQPTSLADYQTEAFSAQLRTALIQYGKR